MTAPAAPSTPERPTSAAAKWRRIAALVRKEAYQLVRDPSSIAIGLFMPAMLILLFGYALSLDVKNVPVAVVLEDAVADNARRLPRASSSRPISRRG